MVEINGKYNTAQVMTDNIEDSAKEQIQELCNQEFTKGENIVIMPDVHAGAGSTIGTTMTLKNKKVVPNLVGVDIGCLDADTEVLTQNGWIKISEYDQQSIMIVDPNTLDSWYEKPKAYIKKPCDEFFVWKNDKGLDQWVSEEHNMLIYQGYKSRGYKNSFMHPQDLANKSLEHGYYSYSAATHLKSTESIDLSDELIRVNIMISADGTDRSIRYFDKKFHYEVHVSKQRKINRAERLLNDAGVSYTRLDSDRTHTTYFYITTDMELSKDLTRYYNANEHQLSVVAEECMKWDGTINEKDNLYFSTKKYNADLIQYAFTVNGIRTCIYKVKDVRLEAEEWADCYQVRPTKNSFVGYNKKPTKQKSVDGKKYCFTISTHAFLARRGDNIFVTGNCGMRVVKLGNDLNIDYEKLDKVIHQYVPAGFNVHSEPQHEFDLHDLVIRKQIDEDYTLSSLGTLGGGNHFIEIDVDSNMNYYLVIHSGSRNLGVKVAKYYQDLAIKEMSKEILNKDALIKEMKARGQQKDIQSTLEHLKQPVFNEDLAYLEGSSLWDYLSDMRITQRYAHRNRWDMAMTIIQKMGWDPVDTFDSIHNYIDLDNMILRKGATNADKNNKLIIPMNMGYGSLICTGLGKGEWNHSAPHGAGRTMSRRAAKENINMNDFSNSMDGIYSTSVVESTIDESPFAYKPAQEIINNISNKTVNIDQIIKPVYSFKAV